MSRIAIYVRALRLPFATASVLPCLIGSMGAEGPVRWGYFSLALCAVAACHLSANLMNDYGDHLSGADWGDTRYYGYFGGSKLIQQGVFSPGFYRNAAILFGVLSAAAVLVATVAGRPMALPLFAPVFFFAWSYSRRPLRLSYNRLGELSVAVLFGPVSVLGSAYLQTGTAPSLPLMLLSMPVGLVTAALLVANEVPDAETDLAAGKRTLVTWIGAPRGYLLFAILVAGALGGAVASVVAGWLAPFALLSLLTVPPAWIVGHMLRRHYREKSRLQRASRITVGLHIVFCVSLILGLIP